MQTTQNYLVLLAVIRKTAAKQKLDVRIIDKAFFKKGLDDPSRMKSYCYCLKFFVCDKLLSDLPIHRKVGEDLKKKRIILALAVILVLASVGLVAADEAGIFTINIFNSPNPTNHATEISNSTIQGQTNYTNSQAVENITLANSTLTLNVNGQNITITDQGDNITINSPNQTPIEPIPIPHLPEHQPPPQPQQQPPPRR